MDGTYYDGEFSNGHKNGFGIQKHKDGTIYRGNFVNDKKEGKG